MAQEFQSIDSLFDFLYLDRGRLSAIMAQVFDDGVLLHSKKTESNSDQLSSDGEASLHFLKGKLANTSANTVSQEMQFDASWTLPLNVLDGLSEHGFISEDLAGSRIGQLRLVKGVVSILDITMLKKLWNPMQEFFVNQFTPPNANSKAKGAARSQFKSMGHVINELPVAPQMHLQEASGLKVWMTLKSDCMVINSDELALKHGGSVPGDWHVLGVIDALPEVQSSTQVEMDDDSMLGAMSGMLNAIREFVGRPSDSYGITPILIFRKIEK
ncbi:DUF6414 family protein [Chromobacterium piscinae]|uniref:DUF6414 family protein n=1 Tax=Chromobacterium piscinae TaxID=686831 RepID=UPI003F814106